MYGEEECSCEYRTHISLKLTSTSPELELQSSTTKLSPSSLLWLLWIFPNGSFSVPQLPQSTIQKKRYRSLCSCHALSWSDGEVVRRMEERTLWQLLAGPLIKDLNQICSSISRNWDNIIILLGWLSINCQLDLTQNHLRKRISMRNYLPWVSLCACLWEAAYEFVLWEDPVHCGHHYSLGRGS